MVGSQPNEQTQPCVTVGRTAYEVEGHGHHSSSVPLAINCLCYNPVECPVTVEQPCSLGGGKEILSHGICLSPSTTFGMSLP